MGGVVTHTGDAKVTYLGMRKGYQEYWEQVTIY